MLSFTPYIAVLALTVGLSTALPKIPISELVQRNATAATVLIRQYADPSCALPTIDGVPTLADGLEIDPNESNAGCIQITNTLPVSVQITGSKNLPTTCFVTLFGDSACGSGSTAQIGPITPGAGLSDCIGPIRDADGNTFSASAVGLSC
ncbi:hypothetical protein B7463_g9305, partial [Scytalidium lignicola]